MNVFEHELGRLKDGIAAALPGVKVQRSLIDHAQLRREELLLGVVTVLLEKIKPANEWGSHLQVLITGQLEVMTSPKRDDVGEAVEMAEAALYARLRAFLRNTGGLPHIEVDEVLFSGQSKAPYGWFLLRAQYGLINEACSDFVPIGEQPDGLYPPDVVVTDLSGVHINIDVEPHVDAAVHQQWVAGDYSNGQPEAKMDLELNQ